MTVSIIIAVKTWQKNLEECVGKCRELDYPDFEIIILPDAPLESFAGEYLPGATTVKVMPTGAISPAQKRDLAINYARGEILAFIDDDAYPSRGWLKNALKNFQDPRVAAVGGPAVTPFDDNLRQKASGLIFASVLVSGKYAYRYLPKNRIEAVDYPTCNLLVRKSIMQALGGFKTNFFPGEDTKLCLDITQGLGKKIIYDPEVLVYHHRRPLYMPHLRQVASYALHRGHFAKRYPQTSFKLPYFIPTLFLLAIVIGGILSSFLAPFRVTYLSGLALYIFLVFIFSLSSLDWRLIPPVFTGIIFTHLTYGFYFLLGLLSKRLTEDTPAE